MENNEIDELMDIFFKSPIGMYKTINIRKSKNVKALRKQVNHLVALLVKSFSEDLLKMKKHNMATK